MKSLRDGFQKPGGNKKVGNCSKALFFCFVFLGVFFFCCPKEFFVTRNLSFINDKWIHRSLFSQNNKLAKHSVHLYCAKQPQTISVFPNSVVWVWQHLSKTKKFSRIQRNQIWLSGNMIFVLFFPLCFWKRYLLSMTGWALRLFPVLQPCASSAFSSLRTTNWKC